MRKLQLSWLCAIGLALCLSVGALAQPTAPGYIRLARLVGDVTVQNKATGETRPGAEGAQISQGYVVRTAANSSVILVFSNGSTINLAADSVLDIEEFLQDPFGEDLRPVDMTEEPTVSQTRLNLTQGELVGNVKTLKREAGSSFTVQTPAGAAGIRGTTFRIVFRPTGNGEAFFSLTTLEGQVGFATLTGVVDTPTAIVSDNQEVVVEVTVNDVTGEVTITTPVAEIAPQAASGNNIAVIAAAVQEVVEAVVDMVLTPESGPVTGGPDQPPGEAEPPADEDEPSTEETPPPPPPVLGRTNPDLTPGDGTSGTQ